MTYFRSFCWVALGLLGPASTLALPSDYAEIRQAFLLNFARYVVWPESSLKPAAPLRFCLAPGDAELSAKFENLTRQSVEGHAIQVKLLLRPADAAECHVIFIPAEVTGPVAAWIGAARKTNALSVSDAPEFVEAGGVIGLVEVGGRFRFDVNLGVARQADLRISSQLLKLARVVK